MLTHAQFSLSVAYGVILTAALASLSTAQGQEPEGFQFNSVQITATSSLDGDAENAVGPAISSIMVGGPDGFTSNVFGNVDPNNRSQLFDLLSNPSIRKELQLSDDQMASVKQIMQDNAKRMSEQLRAAMAASGGNNVQLDLSGIMKAKQAEAEGAIEEILLPEQLKRIRQLAYQIEIAKEGLGESLIHGRLGVDIGVYDGQKQHLTDSARQVEAELRAVIAKAHTAARAKLFAELTPDQRKIAEELVGNYFQYEESNVQQLIREQMKQAKKSAEAKKEESSKQ